MGCVASKKTISITPAIDSSGILRESHVAQETNPASPVRRSRGDSSSEKKEGPDLREPDRSQSQSQSVTVGPRNGSSARSFRMRNIHRYLEGEQVAAGWPPWLSAVAGEAIQGWVPLKPDSFEKLEKVGQGTYSSVFRARDLESGKIVALKKVRFDNFEPESVRFMAREIKILRRLNHPNVMRLEGLITSRLSCSLYLVFEYMEHDLAGLSSSPDIKFSESQVKCYMQQLLSGLEHCHSRGIIHRDIKGANLLVNNEGLLKMADFGLANHYDPKKNQPLTSRVVTLWYRPPELLLGSTNYDVSVDLWSVGCVFAEMFQGKPILQGRTEIEQLHKIFKLCGSPSEEYWKKSKLPHATIFKPHRPYTSLLHDTLKFVPENAFSLLQVLLSVEPYKRGTASTALTSEYFKTKPYACEPSSLPKYAPNKEIDAKMREDSLRRRASNRGREADATRRQSRLYRASREMSGLSKLPEVSEESRANNNKSKQEARRSSRANGDAKLLLADRKPLPEAIRESISIPYREKKKTRQALIESGEEGEEENIPFSGPLIVSSSSSFAWAKKPRDEQRTSQINVNTNSNTNTSSNGVRSHSRSNSRSQLASEAKVRAESKTYENGGNEIAKRAVLKRWSQLDRPDSFDSCDIYLGDDISSRHSVVGEQEQGERVEYSGPLLSQPHKVDELLQRHERHIRQAVRKSWFRRGKRQGK